MGIPGNHSNAWNHSSSFLKEEEEDCFSDRFVRRTEQKGIKSFLKWILVRK